MLPGLHALTVLAVRVHHYTQQPINRNRRVATASHCITGVATTTIAERNYTMKNEYSKLIKSFFGQQNTFTIPKILVQALHSHTKALYLNQLIFWSSKKEDGWFYKKYSDWNDEILISESQIRRFTREFERLGFLETKRKKINNTPHCWYRLDWEKLLCFLEAAHFGTGQNDRMEPVKMTESMEPVKMTESYITEEYTEEYLHNIYCASQDARHSNNNHSAFSQPILPSNEAQSMQEAFAVFWALYPRKRDKKRAFAVWAKKNLHKDCKEIMEKLRQQVKSDAQYDGQEYTPYPSTYLRDERWKDAVAQNNKRKVDGAQWTLDKVWEA